MGYSDQPTTLLDVFFSKEWKSWGVVPYDAEGNQTAEGSWHYRKSEAVADARAKLAKLPHGTTLRIFTKDNCGCVQESLTGREVMA